MNNPKDMYCSNRDAYLDFVDENFISSYFRCNVNSAFNIKDVLMTGKNRLNSKEHFHNIFNDDEEKGLPNDLIKFGVFFRTDDSQIFYTFSTNYSTDKLDSVFNNEVRSEFNLDVKIKDKSENFLIDDCNLVIVSINRKPLPILK